jgi:hypothetical protein
LYHLFNKSLATELDKYREKKKLSFRNLIENQKIKGMLGKECKHFVSIKLL